MVGVGAAQDPRLLQEPLAHVEALGPVVGEGLDRDVRAQLLVAVEPDRREPADAEPLDALEPAEALGQGHPGMVPCLPAARPGDPDPMRSDVGWPFLNCLT